MDPLAPDRVRCPGGGDKTLVEKDPTLLGDLLAFMEPDARGDPMSPLRWTTKSLSQLAGALAAMGHRIGRSAVGDLLHRDGTLGSPHPPASPCDAVYKIGQA